MTEACVDQIRYWMKTVKESQKGHRRKNRTIKRLEDRCANLVMENSELRVKVAELQLELKEASHDRF